MSLTPDVQMNDSQIMLCQYVYVAPKDEEVTRAQTQHVPATSIMNTYHISLWYFFLKCSITETFGGT
ncbi:hypothetical protein AMTR_s00073p00062430 [Amborella trichopoda]|uniref:Uncharacterized protein n=1 Tax=Amborella trichopoda TaxID=13333 RepID=W1NNM8_AMBTC|nr:hypothetical protein AMTR_s00073p00062430 [Amborella trichopoda]